MPRTRLAFDGAAGASNEGMLALAAAFACILVNAFFVAVEFSFAKVRPTALEALARAGDASAARALTITQHFDAYLSATQLGITLASLGLGWLGEPAMTDLLAPALQAMHVRPETAHTIALASAFAIISALHIILGELVPKTLAISRAEQIARRSSLALRTFFLMAYPALWILNGASRLVLRALGLKASEHTEGRLSLEELRLVIHDGVDDANVTRRAILERVLRATDRPVSSIMVPRTEMQVLSLGDPPDAWMERVRRFGFSRYPVSQDGGADHIVGYVYVKDLLMVGLLRAPASVAALRRDILVVGQRTTVSMLIEQFHESAIPIAMVIDEHGGTAGLVTIEDVTLELMGDVRGEMRHSRRGACIEQDGETMCDGRALVADVVIAGLTIDDGKDSSIAAWIVARLGHLATPGDTVDLGDWEAVVDDVRARRVHRVRFRRKRRDSDTDEHATS